MGNIDSFRLARYLCVSHDDSLSFFTICQAIAQGIKSGSLLSVNGVDDGLPTDFNPLQKIAWMSDIWSDGNLGVITSLLIRERIDHRSNVS